MVYFEKNVNLLKKIFAIQKKVVPLWAICIETPRAHLRARVILGYNRALKTPIANSIKNKRIVLKNDTKTTN
jgi:hypothetical protein